MDEIPFYINKLRGQPASYKAWHTAGQWRSSAPARIQSSGSRASYSVGVRGHLEKMSFSGSQPQKLWWNWSLVWPRQHVFESPLGFLLHSQDLEIYHDLEGNSESSSPIFLQIFIMMLRHLWFSPGIGTSEANWFEIKISLWNFSTRCSLLDVYIVGSVCVCVCAFGNFMSSAVSSCLEIWELSFK